MGQEVSTEVPNVSVAQQSNSKLWAEKVEVQKKICGWPGFDSRAMRLSSKFDEQ